MSTLYGFSGENVKRIGSAVRNVESRGGGLIRSRDLHRVASGVNDSSYEGYFLATVGATVASVDVTGGESIVNDDWFTSVDTNISGFTAGDWYLYYECQYTPPTLDQYGSVQTAGYLSPPTFEKSSSLPSYSDTYLRVIIAEITAEITAELIGDVIVITDIIQEQHGMILGYVFDKLTSDVIDGEDGEGNEALQNQLANQFCASGSDCSVNNSGCVRGGSMVSLSGTKSEVTTGEAEYNSSNKITGKCRGLGPAFDTVCNSGKKMIVQALNSKDGVTWTSKFYYCCCQLGKDEIQTACTSCVEQNALCKDNNCTAVDAVTSSPYEDYIGCMRLRTGVMGSNGQDEHCASLDGYTKACCYTGFTDCAVNVDGKWDFTYTPCCCPTSVEVPMVECTDCADNNSECNIAGIVCTAESAYSSSGYTTEEQCLKIQSSQTLQSELTTKCAELNSDTYRGCCFTSLVPCSLEDNLWKFYMEPCCCPKDTNCSAYGPVHYYGVLPKYADTEKANPKACNAVCYAEMQAVFSSSLHPGEIFVSLAQEKYDESISHGCLPSGYLLGSTVGYQPVGPGEVVSLTYVGIANYWNRVQRKCQNTNYGNGASYYYFHDFVNV